MKPEPMEPVHPGFTDEDCAIIFSTAKIRFSDILAEDSELTSFSDATASRNASAKPVLTTACDTQSGPEVGAKSIASDFSRVKEGDDESIASSVGTDSIGSQKRRHKGSNASTGSKLSGYSNNSMRSSETASNDENDNNSTCASETPSQGEKSKIATVIKKAKSKGRKLLSSRRSKKTAELVDEASQVLPLNCDVSCDSQHSNNYAANEVKNESLLMKWLVSTVNDQKYGNGVYFTHADSQQTFFHPLIQRFYQLPFLRHRIAVFVALLSLTLLFPGFLIGLLWGLYIAVVSFLFFFVSEPVSLTDQFPNSTSSDDVLTHPLPEENESWGGIVYKGWMNELRGRYDSATYHVNNTQTVLVRLDSHILRISRPERTVLKHSFHVDPTLTEPEPTIIGQSIFDLTGAKVSLRPKRLAARRWWSRKYPIHIRFPSARSELSTIDSVIQRSQSFQQTDRLLYPSLSRIDFCSSTTPMKTVKENYEVKNAAGFEGDTEDSLESDSGCPAQFVKHNRSNSTGDLGNFSGTAEFRRHKRIKRTGTSLFLFVRTAREKERWFHRFRQACSQYRRPSYTNDLFRNVSSDEPHVADILNGESSSKKAVISKLFERSSSVPSVSQLFNVSIGDFEYLRYINNKVQFERTMSEVLRNIVLEKKEERGGIVNMDLGRKKWEKGVPAADELVLAANAIAARIFFDFCRDAYWCSRVKNKIQSKLATIHLPYFIETLELSNLDLGNVTPEIASIYSPQLDDWGLWVDFDLKYRGRIHLVLETRINLMKLRDGFQRVDAKKKASKLTCSIRAHHYSDEELPESPESSPDEDFGSKTEKVTSTKERTGKKILSIVDRIASSKYFQGASQLKPVKKMMEGISSTRLMLNVYVTCLEGTMTINLPPPPSDRLWYAFRQPPNVSIRAVPQVGDRSVDLGTVSDWIESKLQLLIEKFIVCPNMDDIIVPVMSGNQLLKSGYNQ